MAMKYYTNIEMLAMPNKGEHLVNKKYVDAAISRKVKDPVVAVMGEAIEGTYADGVFTPDNTTDPFIFDGVTIAEGNRVLLIGQTDASQNGIYTLENNNTFKRAEDFDATEKISLNVMIPVQQGDANADVTYVLTNDSAITLDTTALAFAKFRASGELNAVAAEFEADGTETEWTLTHGLNTKIIVVRVVDEDGVECGFKVVADTVNTVKIKADVAPANGDKFIATIVG